jgi:riboflavin synthase
MFTGIVEAVGTLSDVKTLASDRRLRVQTALADTMQPGDSIAVNGVCLTVTERDDSAFCADIGPETARVTTLGGLETGRSINLERPLRADARLGGHFVLGHVDGVGIVEGVRQDGESFWVTVSFPAVLAPLFIRKGSVAVDGVSLTVAGLGDRTFDVQIIPYTWAHTTFARLSPGDKVNLECDMIGKYVVRALELSDAIRTSS